MRTLFAILTACALLFVGSAGQAAEIGLQAMEVRLGLADLEGGGGSSFIFSAAADLGRLTPDLGLELNADFWTKSWGQDYGYLGSSYNYDWTWTNIAFLGHLRYDFARDGGGFRPYA